MPAHLRNSPHMMTGLPKHFDSRVIDAFIGRKPYAAIPTSSWITLVRSALTAHPGGGLVPG